MLSVKRKCSCSHPQWIRRKTLWPLEKAVYTFQCWQNVSKKHSSLMMWGRRQRHVRGSDPASWRNVTVLLVVCPVNLNILTDTVLAVGSVLYWRHPFLKIEEILHSHFQPSLLKKCCNVVWVVNLLKTCLVNQQSRRMWKVTWRFLLGSWWGGRAQNRLLGISSFSFWLSLRPLSLSKFVCCHNKNSVLSPMPTSLRAFWYGMIN